MAHTSITRTSVTIVGCGVIGAMIAYELSLDPGLEVTVYDQAQPAQGATGAALGVMMGIISQKIRGRAWQMRQTSLAYYDRLIPLLEEASGRAIAYNRHGIVMLCFDSWDKWYELQRIRQQQGYTLEMWSPQQLQEHCPQISPNCLGAVYSPGDRQVNPVVLTNALVAAAADRVNFQFNYPIPELEIPAATKGWLVIAAGLGTNELLSRLPEPAVVLQPVLGQAIHCQLPKALGSPDFQPVITGHDIHLVPTSNDRQYWLGATVEFPHGQIAAQPELLTSLYQGAINFCSELSSAKILRQWWGLRPRPVNQTAPVIRSVPGYDRLILATGHYRNGILLAPATAIAVREMITRAC